jgi:glucosamine--fructose-6-phosphate aminotransferase (isomerizing)
MTDHASRLATLTAEPSRDDADDAHRLARVERTRAEMMTQGAAVAATLARERAAVEDIARRLRERPIERVVITGCGDSWLVGLGVRHAWEEVTGWPLEAAQALDYACYGALTANARTLVIGLSAGGDTPAVMDALAAARRRGAFAVGVSNTAASPVLTRFDAGLLVHATRAGWPTQSSTAAMALLVRLAVAVAEAKAAARDGEAYRAELDALPPLMDKTAAELDTRMAAIAERFAAARIVLFAGLGPNFATAAFGAAKIKELSPIHAMAMPLEEYHHYRAQKAGDPLFLVASDPASHGRALDTALVSEKVGGRTVAIVADDVPEIAGRVEETITVPQVRAALAPLVASIPLHLFAYHFAKVRFARHLGYPGAFPDA